jgi:hypothetical protein
VIAELQRKRQFLTLLMSKPVVCYGMFIWSICIYFILVLINRNDL